MPTPSLTSVEKRMSSSLRAMMSTISTGIPSVGNKVTLSKEKSDFAAYDASVRRRMRGHIGVEPLYRGSNTANGVASIALFPFASSPESKIPSAFLSSVGPESHPAGRINPRLMRSAAAFAARVVPRSYALAFIVWERPAGIIDNTLTSPTVRMPIEMSTSRRLIP